MLATCLVKDPKRRPTSEKLLKHPFFKHARTNEYSIQTILEGLPPLGERFKALKVSHYYCIFDMLKLLLKLL